MARVAAIFQIERFPVKYWEGGNEIYLAVPTTPGVVPGNDIRIYKTSVAYAAPFQQFAQGLRTADSSAWSALLRGPRMSALI